MPKFVIERDIPGAGDLTREQLREISQLSCRVLSKLGSEIHWVESYVTVDKIYCIYLAPDDTLIKVHAALEGFPANRISGSVRGAFSDERPYRVNNRILVYLQNDPGDWGISYAGSPQDKVPSDMGLLNISSWRHPRAWLRRSLPRLGRQGGG